MTTRNPFYWILLATQTLAVAASLLWAAPSLAEGGISASRISQISMIKTNSPELVISESLLTTGLSGTSDQGLTPSFCLNIDLSKHHLSFDEQVVLKGQQTGSSFQVDIYARTPGKHQGARCSGSTVMLSTDISALNSTAGDLYTGSLNITISPE